MEVINYILNGERVISGRYFNIRVVTKSLNDNLADIESKIEWIAHGYRESLIFPYSAEIWSSSKMRNL